LPIRKIETDVAGTVWKIEAAPGQTLAPDAPILILECMKMEIPVTAPVAGRLLSIRVAEGDLVAEGQVVAELET
jgi:acetyl-CoA carboxylase biotin carboxyl carrier protein